MNIEQGFTLKGDLSKITQYIYEHEQELRQAFPWEFRGWTRDIEFVFFCPRRVHLVMDASNVMDYSVRLSILDIVDWVKQKGDTL